jgi:endonuclease-8
MPEGDTIFRSARALHRALAGKAVTAFRSTYPLLTRFHDDHPLIGQTVTEVEARGKWLLMHFSGGATLATHMLMSGSWHIYRPGQRWQAPSSAARIVIENAEYLAVGFNVPVAEMHTPESLARNRRIPPPDTDLLRADFDTEAAIDRMCARKDEELGKVLLTQRVLAGIGNVFKSEICFVARLNPFQSVGTVSREQIAEVIAIAKRQLSANVLEDSPDKIVIWRGVGRRTTNNTERGESLWVYGRKGQPCRRCGIPIRSRLQGVDARITFWCPQCQLMPDGRDIDG